MADVSQGMGRVPGRGPGWRDRVVVSADRSYAYRPQEILLRREHLEAALALLPIDEQEPLPGADVDAVSAVGSWRTLLECFRWCRARLPGGGMWPCGWDASAACRWVRLLLSGEVDVRAALRLLWIHGIPAQLNHVMFACSLRGSPFYGSPFYGSPFYGSPFYGSPFYGSPFYGSPFYGSSLFGGPIADPAIPEHAFQRSSAIPAPQPPPPDPPVAQLARPVRVAVLDTGYIPPGPQTYIAAEPQDADGPDADGDGYLDPVAGHGAFVAGIIERSAPGCAFEMRSVTAPDGDTDEWAVARVLCEMLLRDDPERVPEIVVMPFAGYLSFDEWLIGGILALVIEALAKKGVLFVASAGNDAQDAPACPAAFPAVIGVAALDDMGFPAPFSNYGTWVDACAVGVDVVSEFFSGFEDPERRFYDIEPPSFSGWARWSGTSFSAPAVAAALARELAGGLDPQQARQAVIGPDALVGEPGGLNRYPTLGTVVDPT